MLEVDAGSIVAILRREAFHTAAPLPELERRKVIPRYLPQLKFPRNIKWRLLAFPHGAFGYFYKLG